MVLETSAQPSFSQGGEGEEFRSPGEVLLWEEEEQEEEEHVVRRNLSAAGPEVMEAGVPAG